MRIAAYQYAVTSDIKKNFETIQKAIRQAKEQQAELVLFPECALTGYPPRDLPSSSDVDFNLVESCCEELQKICDETSVAFVVGTIALDEGKIYNRAIFLRPYTACEVYDKRALWGWDRDNFQKGQKRGITEYKGFRIGIRICFEVRFPEYFRELYQEKTDLDLVLFYDVTDSENIERYNMIKGHLQTRAVENVCPVLTSNTIAPYQTAPTVLFGRSGQVLAENSRNEEGLIVFDLEKKEYDFGERGRAEISDELVQKQ